MSASVPTIARFGIGVADQRCIVSSCASRAKAAFKLPSIHQPKGDPSASEFKSNYLNREYSASCAEMHLRVASSHQTNPKERFGVGQRR